MIITIDWLCPNAIARANVVAWWERGSRQKVPHFFSFYKSVFLRGLLNHEIPEEDTNQLLSVNSPVAWSWNTLSVRVMWCLPNSGTSGIGLALHVLQSVSDGLLHSFGNCCWYWPSEVVVVSHRRSSKMSWKPITKAKMPQRAPKAKILPKCSIIHCLKVATSVCGSTKSQMLAINMETVKHRNTSVVLNNQFHKSARYEIT